MTNPDLQILDRLLAAGDTAVSGAALARELGLSRVAIWARLDRLRHEGLPIDAGPRRGYRLIGEPATLHSGLLRAHLRRLNAPDAALVLPEVDSTNSEAERQLADGRATPFVVLASAQTRGRGRFGRTWHSPDEGNLYLSAAFRPTLAPDRMPGFTLWMGLRLCDHLHQATGLDLRLKWPNDLLFNGRKLAGMLTEARIDVDRMRDLVFGFGLNINADPAAWPAEVAAVATSLRAAAGGAPLPYHATAAGLVAAVINAASDYFTGHTAARDTLWDRYNALAGREVTVQGRDGPLRGRVAGLAADSGLRLVLADGSETVVHAGEVTLASTPPGP